jgi:hypothetical protein
MTFIRKDKRPQKRLTRKINKKGAFKEKNEEKIIENNIC